ncbi:DUF948 domain-containing protein [uncultured Adlercreutzia sp.]|uniref:DUF948 domain-containing protein n=1 Tax=uncultured Adlercreutzia sp. TaxID=875803 RepID=UPI0025ED93D8|nr:DUF948 domain-containing protein [uncultured Adlercreutzia sp.]MCI9261297.1 DUF948 domain-containing protein [Eggerthellaceae bacterium]
MDFAAVVNVALPIVYVLVGAVLVWFVVELALTIRSTRSTIDDAHKELVPTLQNVEKITAQVDPLVGNVNTLLTEEVQPLVAKVNESMTGVKPAVDRVDPLLERLSLTVDAANLELMRVDQILEDVTQITDSVSKVAGSVDTVTSAPIDLVNTLTGRLRNRFKPRYASDESVTLGAAADAAAHEGEPAPRQATVADAVSAVGSAASALVSEQKARMAERKAEGKARQAKAQSFEDQLDGTAATITNAAVTATDGDTDESAVDPAISPNAAAAQAKPAPVKPTGDSPYTVQ